MSLKPHHILLFLLFTFVAAQDPEDCPPAEDIVYSPFKPWFAFYSGSSQSCWKAASCTYIHSDEMRKQQFAATALVMGLVPLTLRDIAWPERRNVIVSSPLPILAATAVRALGLEPVVAGEMEVEEVQKWVLWMQGGILTNIRAKSTGWTVVLMAISTLGLLVSYMGLAMVEIYSKRSALGCPFPVFGLTWFIVGLVPAAIHTMFSSWRHRQKDEMLRAGRATPVQGADEAWPVQLTWAIYYIAGTLIFTSISAVTVAELTVWVVVLFAVTGTSKLLALYICLLLRYPST
ncbi:hypothetical protein FQN54_004808 [Arachnomyces sp. PD_36]|nr:hypothetical protein FQN54_004808 [Arachnomyces sp. PD_36]